jgi:hypothetical protein
MYQHANMYIIFKENIFSTIGFTQSENYTDNSADDQPDTDYQSITITRTIFLCLRPDDLETYPSSPPKTYKALL